MAITVKRAKGKVAARGRRHLRVRKKLSGTSARPRLVVTRSARHVFVQVVDDVQGRTLVSASTMEPDLRALEADKTAKGKFGRAAYVVHGVRTAGTMTPVGAKVKVDGNVWFEGEVTTVLVSNAAALMGGLRAFPDARMDDGRLEVGVVTAAGRLDWIRLAGRIAVGKTLSSPFVEATQGEKIDIRLDKKLRYDFCVRGRNLDRDVRKDLLRVGIEQYFQATIVREERPTDVYVLTAPNPRFEALTQAGQFGSGGFGMISSLTIEYGRPKDPSQPTEAEIRRALAAREEGALGREAAASGQRRFESGEREPRVYAAQRAATARASVDRVRGRLSRPRTCAAKSNSQVREAECRSERTQASGVNAERVSAAALRDQAGTVRGRAGYEGPGCARSRAALSTLELNRYGRARTSRAGRPAGE